VETAVPDVAMVMDTRAVKIIKPEGSLWQSMSPEETTPCAASQTVTQADPFHAVSSIELPVPMAAVIPVLRLPTGTAVSRSPVVANVNVGMN